MVLDSPSVRVSRIFPLISTVYRLSVGHFPFKTTIDIFGLICRLVIGLRHKWLRTRTQRPIDEFGNDDFLAFSILFIRRNAVNQLDYLDRLVGIIFGGFHI